MLRKVMMWWGGTATGLNVYCVFVPGNVWWWLNLLIAMMCFGLWYLNFKRII